MMFYFGRWGVGLLVCQLAATLGVLKARWPFDVLTLLKG